MGAAAVSSGDWDHEFRIKSAGVGGPGESGKVIRDVDVGDRQPLKARVRELVRELRVVREPAGAHSRDGMLHQTGTTEEGVNE